MTGQSQIVDTRVGTASVADAALGVGETLVLDLGDIGAVVTVDAVDADARADRVRPLRRAVVGVP